MPEATAALRRGLSATRFAQADWVAETGSTNRDLLDELADAHRRNEAVPPAAVLVTDHQTAGRGTKGRSWFDPPGGSLLMSVRLYPRLAPARLHLLTMALSLAAAEACHAVAGVEVGLKWPNDLFARGDADRSGSERKLAGVLAESSVRAARVEALVIGMGLNVNWPAAVPADLADTAVALNQLAGSGIDRVALAVAIVTRFDTMLGELERPGGDAALLERYRSASVTIGRRVRLDLPDGAVTGVAVDVTGEGHIVVDLDASEAGTGGGRPVRRSFAAADVTHLRPG